MTGKTNVHNEQGARGKFFGKYKEAKGSSPGCLLRLRALHRLMARLSLLLLLQLRHGSLPCLHNNKLFATANAESVQTCLCMDRMISQDVMHNLPVCCSNLMSWSPEMHCQDCFSLFS